MLTCMYLKLYVFALNLFLMVWWEHTDEVIDAWTKSCRLKMQKALKLDDGFCCRNVIYTVDTGMNDAWITRLTVQKWWSEHNCVENDYMVFSGRRLWGLELDAERVIHIMQLQIHPSLLLSPGITACLSMNIGLWQLLLSRHLFAYSHSTYSIALTGLVTLPHQLLASSTHVIWLISACSCFAPAFKD